MLGSRDDSVYTYLQALMVLAASLELGMTSVLAPLIVLREGTGEVEDDDPQLKAIADRRKQSEKRL